MQDCVIIHNGIEYTIPEFKNLVLAKGIGGVFTDSSDLTERIVAKYDVLNQEDSVMEMWAKLELAKERGENVNPPIAIPTGTPDYTFNKILGESLQKIFSKLYPKIKVSYTDSKIKPDVSPDVMNQVIGEIGLKNSNYKKSVTMLSNLRVAKDTLDNFLKASLTEEQLKDRQRILKLATGWEQGIDGKWRYELEQYLTPKQSKLKEFLNQQVTVFKPYTTTIGELFEHSELFEIYPELLNTKISLRKVLFDFLGSTQGGFDPAEKSFFVTPNAVDPLGTILHEVQHWIQQAEGFQPGTNSTMVFEELDVSDPTDLVNEVVVQIKEKLSTIDGPLKTVEELNIPESTWEDWDNRVKELLDYYERRDEIPYLERRNYDDLAMELYKETIEAGLDRYLPSVNERASIFTLVEFKYFTLNYNTFKDAYSETTKKTQNEVKPLMELLTKAKEVTDRKSGLEFLKSVKGISLGYDLYRRTIGETEARNISKRMQMSPKDRRNSLLEETEDVDRKSQLFLRREVEDVEKSIRNGTFNQLYEDEIIGQANVKALTILINAAKQRQDTLPHEYAHHYISWFRDTPIVQEGIKRFGSEEALVDAIGKQVVKQKGEAYNWWKKFTTWVLNLLSKAEVLQILTDSFLNNVDLAKDYSYENNTNLTEEEVNRLLQPKGQLTDYSTQEQIRYNTYSGIALTGISANFGKVMGYIFESTPIASLYDRQTDSILEAKGEDIKAIFKEYDVSSAEELVRVSTRFTVERRQPVRFRPFAHFKINGVSIEGMSRDEIQFEAGQPKANIFETIDTIINLAIDNVKEQKLHILGITNANSNSFLNMIGMGIPLKIVSKIFKSPSVQALNEIGRWDSDKLYFNLVTPAQDILANADPDVVKQLARKYGMTVSYQTGTLSVTTTNISTELLDKVYTEQASELEKALSDYAVGTTLTKLVNLNETVFEYAQIFSILRDFPNKKWKVDSIAEKIEKHATFFGETESEKRLKESYTEQIKQNFREASIDYQQILQNSGKEAAEEYLEKEFEEASKSPALYGEHERQNRNKFVNQLLRGSLRTQVTDNNSNVLENTSPLLIPHVYEAYVTMIQFKSIVERIFAVHSPTVQKFVNSVLGEAKVFLPFDKLEKTDAAQKELIRYLTSGLEFNVWDTPVVLSVDPNTEYTISSGNLMGHEAWAQRFIVNLESLNPGENMFLNALEFSLDEATGLKRLKILSDKVNDEELLERIRADFETFAKDNPQAAVDLFKFNLLSNAMYYEKTGFSLIFPDEWAVSFSEALSTRLENMIPVGQIRTQYNLETIKDDFLFQYVRNNPLDVSSPRDSKPVQTEYYKRNNKNYPYYGGKVEVEGGMPIHFDLRFPDNGKAPQKFVRHFGEDIYMYTTSDKDYNYYVKITERVNHSFYSFNPLQVEDSLDLNKLKNLAIRHKIINQDKIYNSIYVSANEADVLEEGSIVYAYSKSTPHITKANAYRVVSSTTQTKDKMKVHNFRLQFVDTVNLTKGEDALSLKGRLSKFVSDQLGNVRAVDSLDNFRELLRRKTEYIGITNNPTPDVSQISLSIPRWESEPTEEAKELALKTLEREINSLSRSKNYFIEKDLLAPLDKYTSFKRKVGQLLYNRISYMPPDIENLEREAKAQELKEYKLLEKQFNYGMRIAKTPLDINRDTNGVPYIKKGDLATRSAKGVKVGDFVVLGKKDDVSWYGMITGTDKGVYSMVLFDENFLLEQMTEPEYEPQQLIDLLLGYKKREC